ncbi:MAG: LysE family transporter [Saprospiraceae bacterium]
MNLDLSGNLIIISVIGLLVGIIFSIPVAGPTSIVIASNALKGRIRYCILLCIGASFADLVYVFISVYGLTMFYDLYKPYIPYVLMVGSVFVIYMGYKIAKSPLDLEHIDESKKLGFSKIKEKQSGFITGILLGFINPTLIVGWMSTSFVIFSMLASYGFNTGGLDQNPSMNQKELHQNQSQMLKDSSIFHLNREQGEEGSSRSPLINYSNYYPSSYPILLSLFYALSVAIGSIIWFYYMTLFLAKFRHRFNIKIIQATIRGLGIALALLGLFLGYKGVVLLSV